MRHAGRRNPERPLRGSAPGEIALSLRRELTFGRAVSALGRWWWFVALCGLVVMAGAYLAVGTSAPATYQAQGRIHAVRTVVGYDLRGDAIPVTVLPRFGNEVNPNDFRLPEVAERATKDPRARGVDSGALLSKLAVLPVSTTDVEVSYAARSARTAVETLDSYVDAYVEWTRAEQARALTDAANSLEKTLDALPNGSEPAITARRLELQANVDRLTLAAKLVPEQIAQVGQVTVSVDKGLPAWMSAAGGLVAGLVIGTLLALLLVRIDRRIRRVSDLDVPAARIVDLPSRAKPESFLRLRSELELAGLGLYLDVLAVTSPSRTEDRGSIALGLGQAFASAGIHAVVVGADAADGAEGVPPLSSGVISFLEGSDDELQSVALAENLTWVPKGEGDVEADALFSSARIDRLFAEARRHGDVVVVVAPPASEPGGLLVAARADVTLLVLQRSRSRWSDLEGVLGRLQQVVKGPVEICFDRTRRTARGAKIGDKRGLEPASLSSATAKGS